MSIFFWQKNRHLVKTWWSSSPKVFAIISSYRIILKHTFKLWNRLLFSPNKCRTQEMLVIDEKWMRGSLRNCVWEKREKKRAKTFWMVECHEQMVRAVGLWTSPWFLKPLRAEALWKKKSTKIPSVVYRWQPHEPKPHVSVWYRVIVILKETV